VGGLAGDVLAPEQDAAGRRLYKTGDAVDGGCFSGSVRTDDAQNFPLADLKTYPVERDDAAEGLGDLLDL